MGWILLTTTVLYWAVVAADVTTTRRALSRGAGRESNGRFVDDEGRVEYEKNLVFSLVTWSLGGVVALLAPYPFGLIGIGWIVVRGSFRLAAAIHNHRLGRAS